MDGRTYIAIAVFTLMLGALASPSFAQITVDPDPLVQGAGNQFISIAIHLGNPSNDSIDAFGFKLTFPDNLLEFVQVDNAGTLTDGWASVSGLEGTAGEVTIGGFHTTPATASGVLLRVMFQVASGPLGAGPVLLSDFVDDLSTAATTAGSFESTIGGGAPGLIGDYYDNRDLTALYMQRIDATVNFDWGQNAPDPGMGANDYSIRWTGWVQPDFSETYTFYTVSDDGVRLWVDNTLIIDQWIDQSATEWSGQIALTAGQLVPVTMEFYERGGDAVAKLLWSSASVVKTIIPAENLLGAPCGQGSGDVDGDALVTSGDATCAFDVYMNEGVLPGSCNFQGYACELGAADANCNAVVTPRDALEIELRGQAALLPADCFAQPAPVPPSPYDVAIAQSVIDDGGTPRLRVTISTANAQGLGAFGFKLGFPTADLLFNRMEPGYVFTGWFMFDAAEVTAGEILTGAFHPAAIVPAAAAEVVHYYFDFTGAPGTVSGLGLTSLVDDFEGANIVATVSSAGDSGPPRSYQLFQNYPNPFNPSTSIGFEVPEGASAHVRVAVYSVRGELVRVLLDEVRAPGIHQVPWDGTNATGVSVPSGVYFYSLTAGNFTQSRRMILLK